MRIIENIIFNLIAPFALKKYLPPLRYRGVSGLNVQVFAQLRREFQVVPPLTLHMLNPRLLAGVWSVCRECLIVNQSGRAMREIVGTAVSRINQCPYCVEVHAAMLHGLQAHQAAENLLADTLDKSRRDLSYLLAGWGEATCTPDAELLKDPPFSETDAPQILGTAIFFHYLNRMVRIFLKASPFPFIGAVSAFRKPNLHMFAWVAGKRVTALDAQPGVFLLEPEDAVLPKEFAWANAAPHTAGALLRWSLVEEEAGRAALDDSVRTLVADHLADWRGEPAAMGRQWLDDLVHALPPEKQPAAKLALLVARAPYQADDAIIHAFLKQQPNKQRLLEAASWAAYMAARRIASWLRPSGLN